LTIDSIRGRSAKIICTLLVFLLLLPVIACERNANRIVVGSKNFTEQLILGELFAQIIEARTHLPVERRFYLAGTFICHQAILAGRIDIYPEYTGTALTAVLKQQPSSDKQEVYRRVNQGYESKFGLSMGPPLGFDDTFAMVIRGEDARQLHLKTLS
jgi:glycine betaine/choline ABC-type transport system substrate-binding protein